MKTIEALGTFTGETLGKTLLGYFRSKVEHIRVDVSGVENVRELAGQSYVLAANHTKPKGAVLTSSGLAPDALILERIIHEQTGRQLKIVAKSDKGHWVIRPLQRTFQQPFGQGFKKAMGFIPVRINPGSYNREFVEAFETETEAGNPILIFPQGLYWTEDFSDDVELKDGAAAMALKYHLAIVPGYLQGADSWEAGHEVKVLFGKHFETKGLSKRDIGALIKRTILDLKKEAAVHAYQEDPVRVAR
jgi:1-acyl-sn-glycerol-3-phosphate acyltransferase